MTEVFGFSAAKYQEYLRVEEVKLLLKDKKRPMKMKVAAEEVGFNSDETFLRILKKHTGLNPLEWKNKPF